MAVEHVFDSETYDYYLAMAFGNDQHHAGTK